MTDQWSEKLQCNSCASTGIVRLQMGHGDRVPTVLSIPDSFKVVQTEYGPEFHCENCNVAAVL